MIWTAEDTLTLCHALKKYGKDYEKLIAVFGGKYSRQQIHQHVFQVKISLRKDFVESKMEGLTAQVARMVNAED